MRVTIFLGILAAFAAACANTSGSGGGSGPAATDTAGGSAAADTKTGSDGTASGTDTKAAGDAASSVGEEKNVVDIQKASEKCPKPEQQSWPPMEMPGVTVRNLVVTSPSRPEGTGGTLVGLWAQQKGGGQWSGIFITGKKAAELGQVKPGDVITVTGDVKDFYCFTEMNAKVVTIESQGKELPVALTVTTDDLGDKAADKSEPFESVLLQLHDVVVADDALGTDGKTHGEQYVGKTADDKALRMYGTFPGVYLSDKTKDAAGKDVFTEKYPKGTKIGTLTGVVEYTFGVYRLNVTKDPEGVVKP